MNLQTYDRFDYLVQNFRETSNNDLVAKLNALGTEGWELVTVMQPHPNTNRTYIFKRKITVLNT